MFLIKVKYYLGGKRITPPSHCPTEIEVEKGQPQGLTAREVRLIIDEYRETMGEAPLDDDVLIIYKTTVMV